MRAHARLAARVLVFSIYACFGKLVIQAPPELAGLKCDISLAPFSSADFGTVRGTAKLQACDQWLPTDAELEAAWNMSSVNARVDQYFKPSGVAKHISQYIRGGSPTAAARRDSNPVPTDIWVLDTCDTLAALTSMVEAAEKEALAVVLLSTDFLSASPLFPVSLGSFGAAQVPPLRQQAEAAGVLLRVRIPVVTLAGVQAPLPRLLREKLLSADPTGVTLQLDPSADFDCGSIQMLKRAALGFAGAWLLAALAAGAYLLKTPAMSATETLVLSQLLVVIPVTRAAACGVTYWMWSLCPAFHTQLLEYLLVAHAALFISYLTAGAMTLLLISLGLGVTRRQFCREEMRTVLLYVIGVYMISSLADTSGQPSLVALPVSVLLYAFMGLHACKSSRANHRLIGNQLDALLLQQSQQPLLQGRSGRAEDEEEAEEREPHYVEEGLMGEEDEDGLRRQEEVNILLEGLVARKYFFRWFPWLFGTYAFINSGLVSAVLTGISEDAQGATRAFLAETAVNYAVYILLLAALTRCNIGLGASRVDGIIFETMEDIIAWRPLTECVQEAAVAPVRLWTTEVKPEDEAANGERSASSGPLRRAQCCKKPDTVDQDSCLVVLLDAAGQPQEVGRQEINAPASSSAAAATSSSWPQRIRAAFEIA